MSEEKITEELQKMSKVFIGDTMCDSWINLTLALIKQVQKESVEEVLEKIMVIGTVSQDELEFEARIKVFIDETLAELRLKNQGEEKGGE